MSGVEIMSIDWNFPGNNFGTLSGIGEAGIETFKGSPCRSLAREICQNSLDARLDPGKPVRVEFSLSYISPGDISSSILSGTLLNPAAASGRSRAIRKPWISSPGR